ncbi:GIY-YIG nuclease family protein [Vibrio coralliirubri]|uniref:GIY-YIG nuclease family protein n=1 Tax=Vibrio coralliirubri TaxID=1516159 RepID=UPI0006384AFC|nr:GIY-YIG nuclease family protein [Vibrio coralliirubri]CDT47823.1 hypothetical protein VCR6J2_470084 [Vibrio coralliirubri]
MEFDFDLDEFLKQDNTEDINFSDGKKPVIQKKDPDLIFKQEMDYLDSIECVVYKIDDGINCYVGRTSSLYHRLIMHKNTIKSKAHSIINHYKEPPHELVTILWKGSYHESIEKEAYYIEKLSTVGQLAEQSTIGLIPHKYVKRARDNSIPKSWL